MTSISTAVKTSLENMTMTELETLASNNLKTNKYNLVQLWKDRKVRNKICSIIEKKITVLNGLNNKNKLFNDKLFETSDDVSHILQICNILRQTGAEKKAKGLEKNIDNLLNNQVKKSLEEKIGAVAKKIKEQGEKIGTSDNDFSKDLNLKEINKEIQDIHKICSKLQKNEIFKELDKQADNLTKAVNDITTQEAMASADVLVARTRAKKAVAKATAAAQRAEENAFDAEESAAKAVDSYVPLYKERQAAAKLARVMERQAAEKGHEKAAASSPPSKKKEKFEKRLALISTLHNLSSSSAITNQAKKQPIKEEPIVRHEEPITFPVHQAITSEASLAPGKEAKPSKREILKAKRKKERPKTSQTERLHEPQSKKEIEDRIRSSLQIKEQPFEVGVKKTAPTPPPKLKKVASSKPSTNATKDLSDAEKDFLKFLKKSRA